MMLSELRVALLSGNYNYTTDGANVALNRLVAFLLSHGSSVRIYSPVVDPPAFAPTGDLIGVGSLPLPGRSDYRLAVGMSNRIERDLNSFSPNIMHISAPETLGHWGVSYARRHDLPVIASVHTRFDTYARYYRLGFLESIVTMLLRRFYRRFDAIVCPSQGIADILVDQHMNDDIEIWPSGVDHERFTPAARSFEWRRTVGIEDDNVVVGFFGRLVLEKGISIFCDTLDELARRRVDLRVLVVGDGPARKFFAQRLPHAKFVGFQSGAALPRALASMDVLFNPSATETFGMVTLEAMSCGVTVVGADAPGTSSLVVDGVSGRLVKPSDIAGFADSIADYAANPTMRAAAGSAGNLLAATYSWDAANSGLAAKYLRVIEQHADR